MSKYLNVLSMVDGRVFDSKAEGRRYLQLKQMQDDGKISELSFQPRFELQPAFVDYAGNKHRPIGYRADFRYIKDGRVVIEDVKGRQTQQGTLRIKMFLFKYRDIELRIVKV